MDRNTFTGLFLMLIIIVGSVFLMRPSDEEIKREQLFQDSIELAKTQGANPVANDTAAINTVDSSLIATSEPDSIIATGPFSSSKIGTEKLITLENELLKVTISN